MSAEQRAEYWKAEHLAGNKLIEQQAEHIRVLREALELAVQQNEHDMLMTGDEIRKCRAAAGDKP